MHVWICDYVLCSMLTSRYMIVHINIYVFSSLTRQRIKKQRAFIRLSSKGKRKYDHNEASSRREEWNENQFHQMLQISPRFKN